MTQYAMISFFYILLLTTTSMMYCDPANGIQSRNYFKTDSELGVAFHKLYNKNNFLTKEVQGKPVIPKIIHQIWLGPNTPPAIFQASQESIRKHHPDWVYRLWTDADIPAFGLYNQKFYDLAQSYGEKADILRYELLYRFGGVYLDVDMVCLKPFDILLQYDLWVCGSDKDGINNAVIGSVPYHPIVLDCILTLEADWYAFENMRRFPENLQLSLDLNVLYKTGPDHFSKSFMKFINNTENIIVFPESYFYPITLEQIRRTLREYNKTFNDTIQSFIGPESFAVHYWAGSWCSSENCKL